MPHSVARQTSRRSAAHEPSATVSSRRVRTPTIPARLSLDEALIALLISAMAANGHVSPRELERAHHLIWSTRRFRGRDGGEVNRMISHMRALLEATDVSSVVGVAIKAIPARSRAAAFALTADLLLADGRLDTYERQFLRRLGAALDVDPERRRRIVDVILLKNDV